MNQPHKTHFIGTILITFFIILLTAIFLIMKNRVITEDIVIVPVQEKPISTVVDKTKSNCGITVTSPMISDKFNDIKKVSVIVDNTKRVELGCGWTVFEAQAGTFKFFDSNNEEIANGILMAENGADWMTSLPVIYEGEIKIIDIKKSIKEGIGKLVITEDDPSGEKIPQTVEIPVKF